MIRLRAEVVLACGLVACTSVGPRSDDELGPEDKGDVEVEVEPAIVYVSSGGGGFAMLHLLYDQRFSIYYNNAPDRFPVVCGTWSWDQRTQSVRFHGTSRGGADVRPESVDLRWSLKMEVEPTMREVTWRAGENTQLTPTTTRPYVPSPYASGLSLCDR